MATVATAPHSTAAHLDVTEVWATARATAGLQQRTGLPSSTSFLWSWLRFTPHAHSLFVAAGGSRCVWYHRIWKGGNEAITRTLKAEAKSRGWRSEDSHGSSSRPPPWCLAANASTRSDALLTFTFVREPLAHFISGYAEFVWRTSHHRGNVTEAEATATLRDLLDGTAWQGQPHIGEPFFHMAPQAGVLRGLHGRANASFAPVAIGRLELAQQDWEAIFGATALNNSTLSDHGRPHATSADLQGARRSMVGVLRRRADLRRGLCALLAPDYALLDQLLPGSYKATACGHGYRL